MSSGQEDQWSPRISQRGATLVALAFIAVLLAYPPLSGVRPLFGVGSFIMATLVSMAAVVLAAAGGLLLGRSLTGSQTGVVFRVAVPVLTMVAAVAVVSAYLQIAAGYDFVASLL